MTIVGVPKEIKADEHRVGLTPAGVRELVGRGHEVLVEAGAGEGSSIADAEYTAQGATILPDADAVFAEAELVVKVKEPQPVEIARLRPARRCSRICISLRIRRSRTGSSRRVPRRSPTRRSPMHAAGCRCWPR